MATETDCWPCPDPPAHHQHHQDVPISEILNHGSISFGRFAVESLEWEKRSVFSHNRCKEELEKFRAPGLVASKKAYFEEYYRKVRAMKALQVEQQEAAKPDSCQVENGVDEVKISNGRQIHISDNGTATPFSGNTEERLSCGIGNDSSASMPESDATTSLPTGHSKILIHEVTSSSSIRPVNSSAAKGSEGHSIGVKTKGTVAYGIDKAKSDRVTTKTAVNTLEKQKKPSNKETTRNTNTSLVSRKSNGVPSIRQKTEVCPGTNVLRTKANNKPVLSSPSVRSCQVKMKQTSKPLDKVSTRLPVQARPVLSTSRPNLVNSSLRDTTLDDKRSCNGVAGKSLEVNGHRVRPKSGEYQTQRPRKVMSSKLPGQDKLNQNTVVEVEVEVGRGNHIKAGKQNEEKSQSSGLAVDPRGVSSSSPGAHKAPITNRAHKVSSTLSADTKQDQRAPRRTATIPSWR